jgi:hypothetical protein
MANRKSNAIGSSVSNEAVRFQPWSVGVPEGLVNSFVIDGRLAQGSGRVTPWSDGPARATLKMCAHWL